MRGFSSASADDQLAPRRVLFVESYPHVLYGQQQTLLALLDAHDPAKLDPVVAMPAAGPFADELRARKIPIRLVPYPALLASYGGTFFRSSPMAKARAAWQAANYAWRLRTELRELRIEGVFCNDTRGLLTVGLAARSLGLPVMIWEKLEQPQGWLDALQLPLATINVVIANAVLAKCPAWQVRLFRRKITQVFDGVDVALFQRAREIRAQLGLAENDTALAVVGTITHRKGQDRILQVIDRLVERAPSVKLLMVGGPISEEDRRFFDRLPNNNHPRVAWLGVRRDIPEIMKSVDILVAPSRYEGMSRVCVEAMAAGKPVVAARIGGIPEVVVDGETGLLFDGDDADALVECLVRLSASREHREQLGAAGKLRAARCFDGSRQMQKVLDLLIGMIPPRNARNVGSLTRYRRVHRLGDAHDVSAADDR
jgi:glycosyltransferase involved in cell wall biosynthesis